MNYGKGATLIGTKKSSRDLILIFDAKNHGIPEDDYVAKLIGKTKSGELLIGYARLPWVRFDEAILSARLPVIKTTSNGYTLSTEVQNFGQFTSKTAIVKLTCFVKGEELLIGEGKMPPLAPFQKMNVDIDTDIHWDRGVNYDFVVGIEEEQRDPVLLHGKIIPAP